MMQLLFPLIGINNSWTAVVIAQPPAQSKLLPISCAEFPLRESKDTSSDVVTKPPLLILIFAKKRYTLIYTRLVNFCHLGI